MNFVSEKLIYYFLKEADLESNFQMQWNNVGHDVYEFVKYIKPYIIRFNKKQTLTIMPEDLKKVLSDVTDKQVELVKLLSGKKIIYFY